MSRHLIFSCLVLAGVTTFIERQVYLDASSVSFLLYVRVWKVVNVLTNEGVTGVHAVSLREGAASARIKPLLPVLCFDGLRMQSCAESLHGTEAIKRPKEWIALVQLAADE
jgi:hypothetical protein